LPTFLSLGAVTKVRKGHLDSIAVSFLRKNFGKTDLFHGERNFLRPWFSIMHDLKQRRLKFLRLSFYRKLLYRSRSNNMLN